LPLMVILIFRDQLISNKSSPLTTKYCSLRSPKKYEQPGNQDEYWNDRTSTTTPTTPVMPVSLGNDDKTGLAVLLRFQLLYASQCVLKLQIGWF
jgi:hypothetical protein